MSVIQKLKSALPLEDEGAVTRTYECQECGHTFESGKTPDKAMCPECVRQNVQKQDETTV